MGSPINKKLEFFEDISFRYSLAEVISEGNDNEEEEDDVSKSVVEGRSYTSELIAIPMMKRVFISKCKKCYENETEGDTTNKYKDPADMDYEIFMEMKKTENQAAITRIHLTDAVEKIERDLTPEDSEIENILSEEDLAVHTSNAFQANLLLRLLPFFEAKTAQDTEMFDNCKTSINSVLSGKYDSNFNA